MRTLITVLFVLIPVLLIYSQPTFERTYGTIDDDAGCAVSVCNDDSYIIAGSVDNIYTGDPDIFIARIDIYGDTIWTRTIVNEYHWDCAYDVLQCFDLGFIITGSTYNDEGQIPFLAKFLENGQLAWYKTYADEVPEGYAHSLVEKPDSGYVICGRQNFYNDWYHHPFLIETNTDGDCLHYKLYDSFPGISIHYVYDMCLSADNDYVLCGRFKDIQAELIYNSWLFNIETNLYVSWDKKYSIYNYTTYAVDVELAVDGGYIFCGTTYPGDIVLPNTDFDIFLVKTDDEGNEEWRNTLGFVDQSEHGSCIDLTEDGCYIMCSNADFGLQHDDIWLIKINESGDTLWTQKYGGIWSDGAADICTTSDGGFIICGSTDSYGIGGSDIYLIKTNNNGIVTTMTENDNELTGIDVLPNPCNEVFYIRNCPDVFKYEIYNINGKKLLEKEVFDGKDVKVDISNILSGIYILCVKSDEHSRSMKIIKK